MVVVLTEQQCRYAMDHGEFNSEILLSAPRVAIVLTQSWCPQWMRMRTYLQNVESLVHSENHLNTMIFYLEYDTVPWFEAFMEFKENIFNNREIPYVRYYKNGKLTGESNYVSLEGFVSRLR